MAYCAKLVAKISPGDNLNSVFLISQSVRRSGGEDTLSTFPSGSKVKATFNVHPIITICLWPDGGCDVSGFLEPRTIALLEPASQQSQCSPDIAMDVKVKMNIFGWVKMKLEICMPWDKCYKIFEVSSSIFSIELIKLSTIWSGCVKSVLPSLTNDGSVCGRKSSQVGLQTSEALISDSSRDPSNPGSVEVPAGSCTGSVTRQVPSHPASSPGEVQLNRRDLSVGNYGAHKCYDSRTVARVPWVDKDGNGCLKYAQDPKWCNQYLVNTYARDGNNAGDMCCICGGGTRVCIQETWKFPCLGPPPGSSLSDSSRQAVNSAGSLGPIIGGVVGGLVALISFGLCLRYYAKNNVALPSEQLSHPSNLVTPSGHNTGGIQVVSSEVMFASPREELSHPPNLQNPSGHNTGGIQVVSGDVMPASVADPSGGGVWEPQKDLQTGKIYWTNHTLQKTTWDPPTGGTAGRVVRPAQGGAPHVSFHV